MKTGKSKYRYFKTEQYLISHCTDTVWYKVENTIHKMDLLSQDSFQALFPEQIKKNKFCELMNVYFKSVNHSWKFDYTEFKKLPNFEKVGNWSYPMFNNVPKHKITEYQNAILVYHWGRVWYFSIGGGDFPKGQLLNPYTKKFTGRWADLKNLAPILNLGTKKVI